MKAKFNSALDILKAIKEIANFKFGDDTQPEVQMKEYSLDNGMKVMISDLAVGGSVKLEDGSPAPVGGHTLADGTKIEVSEGGVIAAVMPAEMPEDEMGKDKDKYESRFEEMGQSFAGLNAKFEAVSGELATLKQAFAKQEELNQKFISILDTLVQPEPEPQKTGFIKTRESKQSKLDKAIQILKN